MKSITTHKKLTGLRVLVRADYNISVHKTGAISPEEATRIEKSLETIRFLKKEKAKIIIISHIGRSEEESLESVYAYLSKKIKLRFLRGHIDSTIHEAVAEMKSGEVVLLENLRQDSGEVENKSSFARGLSRLADVFVNDAFAVSHRRHASIVGLPKFLPSYTGLLMEQEIQELSRVRENPAHPFVVIIGGAKFETKLPLIKRYIKIADYVFVGGALANNFFKVQGFEVGKSLVDDKKYNLGSLLKNKKLIVPHDVVVARKNKHINISVEDIQKDDMVVDIGQKTIENLQEILKQSQMVLWNGPLGLYDKKSSDGTDEVLKFLSKHSKKIHTVVGGGDTLFAIRKNKLEKKLSFVSTGGGAMLEFLQKGTLPGIESLKKK